ncbi:MAG: RluA family pseudouridine synthase [Saprospiraceae bacterium]|nr:RluA family pseudouridine synthase [Saprospiraceae bacterium]
MIPKHSVEIIFENEDFIVINKASGLLSIPDRFDPAKPNAFNMVSQKIQNLWVVHRIDRDTSGLLIFAKNAETHKLLNLQFENQQIHKLYIAICQGTPPFEEGLIEAPIAHSASNDGRMVIHPKGKTSETLYKLSKTWKNFSQLECKPLTGRTHQIRVHLAYIGCPIVGDPLYGLKPNLKIEDIKKKVYRGKFEEEGPDLIHRTALHASAIEFNLGDQKFHFNCPLPKDMRAVVNQLNKWQ